ncbi:MAG: oligosaccharide flippase family protein [Desulfobulbaceae bacterium]|nr:oligosaccharide flippase family protein [Desulfobulbaceae bacterium]
MSSKLKNRLNKLRNSKEFRILGKGFSGALFQKVLGATSSFALAVLIARYLGAEQTGVYYTAFNIAMFCTFIGRAGFDQIIMRETASALSINGSSKRFQQIWSKIFIIVIIVTFLISITIYTTAPFTASYFKQPQLEWIIRLFILAIVATVVFNMAAQISRGANNIWRSSFILFASNPISCLIIISGFLLLGKHNPFSPINVVVLSYSLAAIITAFLSMKWAKFVLNQIKHHCSTAPDAFFKSNTLIYSGFSFFVYGLGIRGTSWVASLVLAKFHEAGQVAIFNSAVRVSTAVSFILTAVVATVGPRFVMLYRDGQYDKLKKLYLGSIGLTMAIATPIVLGCWLYNDAIMGVFGSDFVKGGPVLIILTIGQFFSAAVGPQAQILIAIDREHILKNLTIMGFAICTLLHLTLVPHYGAVGSAIATSTTVILINLVTVIIVSRFWAGITKGT